MIRTPANAKMVTFWSRNTNGNYVFHAYKQEDYLTSEYDEGTLYDVNFYSRVLAPAEIEHISKGCASNRVSGWIPFTIERKVVPPKFVSLEEESPKIPFLRIHVTEFFRIAHFIYQRVNENKNLNAVNLTEGTLVSIPDDRLCTLLDVTINWRSAEG